MEVMIALTIFTVGILGVAGMQMVSLAAAGKAQGGLYDSAAVAATLEELLRCDYDDARLTDPDDAYDFSSPDHGPFQIGASRSTIEWEVDDDFPAPGSKRITIHIRHMDQSMPGAIWAYAYVKARDYR